MPTSLNELVAEFPTEIKIILLRLCSAQIHYVLSNEQLFKLSIFQNPYPIVTIALHEEVAVFKFNWRENIASSTQCQVPLDDVIKNKELFLLRNKPKVIQIFSLPTHSSFTGKFKMFTWISDILNQDQAGSIKIEIGDVNCLFGNNVIAKSWFDKILLVCISEPIELDELMLNKVMLGNLRCCIIKNVEFQPERLKELEELCGRVILKVNHLDMVTNLALLNYQNIEVMTDVLDSETSCRVSTELALSKLSVGTLICKSSFDYSWILQHIKSVNILDMVSVKEPIDFPGYTPGIANVKRLFVFSKEELSGNCDLTGLVNLREIILMFGDIVPDEFSEIIRSSISIFIRNSMGRSFIPVARTHTSLNPKASPEPKTESNETKFIVHARTRINNGREHGYHHFTVDSRHQGNHYSRDLERRKKFNSPVQDFMRKLKRKA